MELKKILKDETNLKVAENHFISPPPLPYIVFIENKDIRGVSKDNIIIENNVSVELYTAKPDEELSNKVRNIIIDKLLINNNDDEFEIDQDLDYIEEEQMYMTTFDFLLIEKGGN